ncbi:MAG: hypothetical protein MJZ32_08560 [Bacteroidaceae bacterium]|nr:hypothetical protein [Bacteroidaceae bacterium]
MKQKIMKVALALVLVASASSCSTEYRTLSRMEKLTNNIEKYGERYTVEDWKEAISDYKAIEKDIKRCNFTSEERERMGEMEGRAVASFAKWAGDKVKGVYTEGKGFLNGILDTFGLGDILP